MKHDALSIEVDNAERVPEPNRVNRRRAEQEPAGVAPMHTDQSVR